MRLSTIYWALCARHGMDRISTIDPKRFSVGADCCRAFRPKLPNRPQPLLQHRAKPAWARVLNTAELLGEAVWTKQGDDLRALCDETPVAQPHKQVKQCRGTGEDFDGFEVGRNRVASDLSVEPIGESDDVFACGTLRGVAVPDLRLAEEIEPAAVDDGRRRSTQLRREENRRTEES